MANNALAPKRSNKLYYDDTGASDLDLAVQKQFGLQPGLDRANLIPYKDPRQGWIAPEWLYQAAKAIAAPSVAYQGGNISPEETANVAMTIGGGGVATGAAAPAPANALGMFIGRRAAQWNPKMLAVAEELERKGATPQEIWQQTGTWRAPDGQWRQEISDEAMAFRGANFDQMKGIKMFGTEHPSQEMPIGGMLTHDQFFANYPNTLRNTRMYVQKWPEWLPDTSNAAELGTRYDRTSGKKYRLEVRNKTEEGALKSTTHELQHMIQEEEGFAGGGQPSDFIKEASQIVNTDPKYKDLTDKEKSNLIHQLSFNMYKSLAGEAEARAAAVRRNMTSEQRRATFPVESYDIPISQLRKK